MFTLVLSYIIFYLLSLFLLLFFFWAHNTNKNISQWSFLEFLSLHKYYSKKSWVLNYILLQLAGLPPFGFFLIKIEFVLSTLEFMDGIVLFLIFLNFLLSMFFYIKFFKDTNFKPTNTDLIKLSQNLPIYIINSKEYNLRKYKFYLCFMYFILMTVFSLYVYFEVHSFILIYTM